MIGTLSCGTDYTLPPLGAEELSLHQVSGDVCTRVTVFSILLNSFEKYGDNFFSDTPSRDELWLLSDTRTKVWTSLQTCRIHRIDACISTGREK